MNSAPDPGRETAAVPFQERIRTAALAAREGGAEALRELAETYPFGALLIPFVTVFEAEVRRQCRPFESSVNPEAWQAVRRHLLDQLGVLCLPALELQFAVHQALSLIRTAPSAIIQYEHFVDCCLADGFSSLFTDYPGLLSACATLVRTRAEAAAEAMARYEADRPLLAQHFCAGMDPGPIRALRLGLSDPHHGGRSVARIVSARGPVFYYHPRELGLPAAFNTLLAWINARGEPHPFRITRILERPGYGWMEEILQAPCTTAQAVERFYHRAGQLLCLVYILNGTDIHNENLVACGEDPVLIDLETLLQPELDPTPGQRAEDPSMAMASQTFYADSVLRTLMLPTWRAAPGGGRDISALGSPEDAAMLQEPYWEPLNRDGMKRNWRTLPWPPGAHAVRLGQARVAARDHLPALVAGFSWMYAWLQANRIPLLAAGGPLAAMKGLRGRLIYRSTRFYWNLLRDLARPDRLRARPGSAQGRNQLEAALGLPEAGERLRPLLLSEAHALSRLDVPRFTYGTDREDLGLEGAESLRGFFPVSGFKSLGRRLDSLGPSDLDRQLAYIRGRLQPGATPASLSAPAKPWLDQPCLAPEAFVQQAVAVAERLRITALSAHPGSATWLGARRRFASGHEELGPLGCCLYDGQAGVAHFLAALEFATGGCGYQALALAALQPIRHHLGGGNRLLWLAGLGLGGATGCGSLVYSLCRCAGWLGLPELLEDAARAAEGISPQRITEDRALDVMAGCAGACLGLLALHASAPSGRWLEAAIACGDHLLAHQIEGPSGSGAWATLGDGALDGGFAHGAAGIAYALLRLFTATGEGRFQAGAERAYAFDRTMFDPEKADWTDRWHPADGARWATQSSWCHGAPGIGLALVGGLPGIDAPRVRQDIDRAVTAVLRQPLDPIQGLCCGTFGRVELLLTAGLRLDRADWCREGLRLGSAVLARAGEDPFGLGEFQFPSFFRGGAGCAYEALRLAFGNRLPSVLLWE
jgi:type 2 lantibiotic biosynthesis protein LanM